METRSLEDDVEKLHDFSDHIIRRNKGLERNGDPEWAQVALADGGTRILRGVSRIPEGDAEPGSNRRAPRGSTNVIPQAFPPCVRHGSADPVIGDEEMAGQFAQPMGAGPLCPTRDIGDISYRRHG